MNEITAHTHVIALAAVLALEVGETPSGSKVACGEEWDFFARTWRGLYRELVKYARRRIVQGDRLRELLTKQGKRP